MTKPPPLWLMIIIVGLPLLSETAYTPSLPQIAIALSTSGVLVEHTLTIYLFGFAIGTLFWGRISDSYGRKSCMIFGFICYVIGCIGCYLSQSIDSLMIYRFVQGTGGAVGSVLAQSVSRDAFEGPTLGKMFSAVGSALPIFAGIGPVLGGFISHYLGYRSIFILLAICGVMVTALVSFILPETHHKNKRVKIDALSLFLRMARDKHVIRCSFIVGAINGIIFSYHAEGPFFMIKALGLFPAHYGFISIFTSCASVCGGLMSRYLHNTKDVITILGYGTKMLLISTAIFLMMIIVAKALCFTNIAIVLLTTFSMMLIMCSISMIGANTLQIALTEYKHGIGTASSILGFSYYALVSIFTYITGLLHNGTLWPMPVYFVFFAASVFFASNKLSYVKNQQ